MHFFSMYSTMPWLFFYIFLCDSLHFIYSSNGVYCYLSIVNQLTMLGVPWVPRYHHCHVADALFGTWSETRLECIIVLLLHIYFLSSTILMLLSIIDLSFLFSFSLNQIKSNRFSVTIGVMEQLKLVRNFWIFLCEKMRSCFIAV